MGTRVYIGNLPNDVEEHEIEKRFGSFGRIRSCDVKGGRDGSSRFAFVEYEDSRDAADAVRKENGSDFGADRMRVEHARGGRDRFEDRGRDRHDDRSRGYDDYRGGGRDRYDDRYDRGDRYDSYDRGGRGGLGPSPYGPSRKTEWEVEVSGLDTTMSWQDLKDHFRIHKLEATHADVDRRGNGTVMFASIEDMEDAIKLVDGTIMKNMRGECTLGVHPVGGGRGNSRGHSRGRSRSIDR